jgi:hypothetical protein
VEIIPRVLRELYFSRPSCVVHLCVMDGIGRANITGAE